MKKGETHDGHHYHHVFDVLLEVFSEEHNDPRLSVPLLNTYEYLMSNGFLDQSPERDVKEILKITWTLIRTGDTIKKLAGASLLCSALRFAGGERRMHL